MAVNDNTVAAQPALKADDPMADMAHSEAHYFNRFVLSSCRICKADSSATGSNVAMAPLEEAKFDFSYNHHGIHEEMLVSLLFHLRRAGATLTRVER